MPALLLAACASQEAATPVPAERTIALTFDDATLPDGPLFSGWERTERLNEELLRAGVEEAMFFITTGNVGREEVGAARVAAYEGAGHTLGNHSHTHQRLHEIGADAYIADFDTASEILAPYENLTSYFRYPYLDEGRDVATRDQVRMALAERGMQNGYVTVDTWDWYLVNLTAAARDAGIEVDLEKLGALYVDVIMKSTEYYDAMARRTLGRSPHHVLLLHENDLAALYTGDLVAALEDAGFRIIPATEAFTDPIAQREPDTLYLGQGRIAALAHEGGADPATLRSPTENQAYLKSRFEAEVIGTSLNLP